MVVGKVTIAKAIGIHILQVCDKQKQIRVCKVMLDGWQDCIAL
jgi:hypothetical protein